MLVYVFFAGPTLFSALNGQDIYIPKNDSRILIPCTVSNPDVIVTLEKSINVSAFRFSLVNM